MTPRPELQHPRGASARSLEAPLLVVEDGERVLGPTQAAAGLLEHPDPVVPALSLGMEGVVVLVMDEHVPGSKDFGRVGDGERGRDQQPDGCDDLMKVASGGGRPTPLARVTGFRGGAWDPTEQFIYYTPFLFDGVYRIPADGGDPERITEPAQDGIDTSHMWPTVLPNGDLLFTSCCSHVQTMILEGASPDATPRPLPLEGGSARYVSSGHLLFMQRASVLVASYS